MKDNESVTKGKLMPCMCWYDPPEESKKLIKSLCQKLVDEIKRLEEEGDPIGISIKDTKELLDHLYNPEICRENESVTK